MKGVILIISGPSGVGKTTICKQLAKRLNAFLSVSVTTRPRRANEVDGQDYTYVSREQFERDIAAGRYLEYAKVYGGQFYGTPAGPVEKALAAGQVVILEIEIEGTLQVKARYPEALGVYILAPTDVDQQARLSGRKQDSEDAIRERLSKADGEIRYAQECGAYNHFLINHDVEACVNEIARLVQEKQKT